MIITALRLLTFAAAILAAVPGAAQQVHPERLHVHDPYARALQGQGGAATGYFVIHNNTGTDLVLTGVSSDIADLAGFHSHVESADGLMQMLPIAGGVSLPAGVAHEFVRGGDHVMLIGLTRSLSNGDTITLTLTFDAAAPLIIEAVVDNSRAPSAHEH